jgi:hypothetical protein
MRHLDTYQIFEGKKREKRLKKRDKRKGRLKRRVKKVYSDINNFKVKNALNWGRRYKDKLILLGKREALETKEAINILIKMISNKKVTDNEKELLRRQSIDILKIISTAALPLPITAILVALGKKYNFEIFPADHKELLKEIEREKKIVKDLDDSDDINESLLL